MEPRDVLLDGCIGRGIAPYHLHVDGRNRARKPSWVAPGSVGWNWQLGRLPACSRCGSAAYTGIRLARIVANRPAYWLDRLDAESLLARVTAVPVRGRTRRRSPFSHSAIRT